MNFNFNENIFDDNIASIPYDKESGNEIKSEIKKQIIEDYDDNNSVCTTDCETVESESSRGSSSPLYSCEGLMDFDSCDDSKEDYSRESECRKRRRYRAEVIKSKRLRLSKPMAFRTVPEFTVPDDVPIKLLPRKVRNRLSAIRSRGRELEKEENLTFALCSLAATVLEYENLYPDILFSS